METHPSRRSSIAARRSTAVRDVGVAGSNPATPTSWFAKPTNGLVNFPDLRQEHAREPCWHKFGTARLSFGDTAEAQGNVGTYSCQAALVQRIWFASAAGRKAVAPAVKSLAGIHKTKLTLLSKRIKNLWAPHENIYSGSIVVSMAGVRAARHGRAQCIGKIVL
jgi:hypothetical protein